jgi:hypothetical protein
LVSGSFDAEFREAAPGVVEPLLVLGWIDSARQVMCGQPPGEVGALDSLPEASKRIEMLHLLGCKRTVGPIGVEERGADSVPPRYITAEATS